MRAFRLALMPLVLAATAEAQTLQSLAVGPQTSVAVAPRGAVLPAPGAVPALAPVPPAVPFSVPVTAPPLSALPSAGGGGILGAFGLDGVPAAAVLVPLAAAALGSALPGSGGGSAPARTR